MWRDFSTLGLLSLMVFLMVFLRTILAADELPLPDHPDTADFTHNLNRCRLSGEWCRSHTQEIIEQATRLANDYSALLIPDVAQSIFQDAYFYVDPSSVLGNKFNHILGSMAFSQGDIVTAEKYWSSYNHSDLISIRSLASQVVMKGSEERRGLKLTLEYINLLQERFQNLLQVAVDDKRLALKSVSPWSSDFWKRQFTKWVDSIFNTRSMHYDSVGTESQYQYYQYLVERNDERPFAQERSELMFLELLLNEAQGYIRTHTASSDLALNIKTMEDEFNSAQRFRLAVGLAKLGLFDLSLRHIWLSATPWEAPLYLLRARLVFAPVQKSIRQLALAVDNFETQAEQILAQPRTQMPVPLMEQVCDSPNEAALALQSLPLLHLAGYSSPRHTHSMGHSPVALSVLLSEVYCTICPVRGAPAHLAPLGVSNKVDCSSSKGEDKMSNRKGSSSIKEETLCETKKRGKRRKRKSTSTQGKPAGGEKGSGAETEADGAEAEAETEIGAEAGAEAEVEVEAETEAETETETDAAVTSYSTPIRSIEIEENHTLFPPKEKLSQTFIKLGIVSGSFDGMPGKITVGFVESIRRKMLYPINVELIAMCFPTPRDNTTDRAGFVFDKHINLSPINKTQAILRIWEMAPDFIIFADALLDSRVFALAHERLATWQGALWGWGNTIGVNTIDYYFISEPLWHTTSWRTRGGDMYSMRMHGCPLPRKRTSEGELHTSGAFNFSLFEKTIDHDTEEKRADTYSAEKDREAYVIYPPSDLFSEQVILLRGLPPLPVVAAVRRAELWSIMRFKYFLPMPSHERSNHLHALHLYLFPGSVRHMHPEFDHALYILLKTDPAAMVVMAVPKSGRDNLPTVHTAVRHDLMHPAMPAAAVAKLKQRLRKSLGSELCKRVRMLPPLDERVYHSLRRNVIAVLDPYPVGAHVAVLQAMKEGVPVVSAPSLQECTNSHAVGISRALRLSKLSWPASAEEYAVEAIRLQREEALRLEFVPPDSLRTSFIPRPRKAPNEKGEYDHHQGDDEASDMIEVVGDTPGEASHGEQLVSFVSGLVHGAAIEMQIRREEEETEEKAKAGDNIVMKLVQEGKE